MNQNTTSLGLIYSYPVFCLTWGPDDDPAYFFMDAVWLREPLSHRRTCIFLRTRRWHIRGATSGGNLLQSTALIPPVSMIIDTPQAYGIVAGSFFVAFFFVRIRGHFEACFEFAHRLALRHLAYPQLIRRRRFIGPWTRADVLVQLLFFAANAFCIGFRALSVRDAGWRAAHLSLINLIPAYGGPHLSFLSDVFGVSLGTFRLIHRSAGVMSLPLLIFHVGVAMATRTPFPLRVAENMWGLVVRPPVSFLPFV
jgi:hypothetical protein